MKRVVVSVLSVALMLACSAAAATPSLAGTIHKRQMLTVAVRAVLASGAPGAEAMIRRGGRTDAVTAGYANLASHTRMTPQDKVRIGSITKTFVAVVALQLVAADQIGLDDTVETRLPGLLPSAGQVTVRQLLNHTSGIPDYLDQISQMYASQPGSVLLHWEPSQLVGLVASKSLLFAPGTSFSYSNTDYILIGMIIQRVTGQPLAHEIQARILDPLELRHSSFPTDDTNVPAPAASGYVQGPGGTPLDVTAFNPSAVWAAGAMISTLEDTADFYRTLLTGGLLPAEQLNQMLTYVAAGGFAYGLGIFQVATPCGPAIGHNGAVLGYVTDVFTSPDGKRQVSLAANMVSAQTLQAQEAQIGRLFCG